MELILVLIVVAAVALICPAIAYGLAKEKGRDALGWGCLAFLLGPIGVIIAALLPDTIESRMRKEHEFRRRYAEYERREQDVERGREIAYQRRQDRLAEIRYRAPPPETDEAVVEEDREPWAWWHIMYYAALLVLVAGAVGFVLARIFGII